MLLVRNVPPAPAWGNPAFLSRTALFSTCWVSGMASSWLAAFSPGPSLSIASITCLYLECVCLGELVPVAGTSSKSVRLPCSFGLSLPIARSHARIR